MFRQGIKNNRRGLPPGIKTLLQLITAVILVAFLASCGEPEPTAPPVEEIITSASATMAGLEGFHFTISVSGQPVFLDGDETLALAKADGFYSNPDRAMGSVAIQMPGLVTNVDVVSINQQQWLTNILTGDWMAMPPEWGFNPAVLFDTNDGFLAILTTDLLNPVLTGTGKAEDGPDQELYIIDGRLSGERLAEITLGLLGPDDLDVRLWIDPESFAVMRTTVTNPAGADEDSGSTWQIDLDQFGEKVTIEPPQ